MDYYGTKRIWSLEKSKSKLNWQNIDILLEKISFNTNVRKEIPFE